MQIDPNPAIAAIDSVLGDGLVHVAKMQPPDGLVLELGDGSWWSVTAHLLKREDKP